MSTNMKRSRPSSVRFAETTQTVHIQTPTNDEDLYYNESDLRGFKENIRLDVCLVLASRLRRQGQGLDDVDKALKRIVATSKSTTAPYEMSIRGLETMLCSKRQRNKKIAIKAVLESQRRLKARRAAVMMTAAASSSSLGGDDDDESLCRRHSCPCNFQKLEEDNSRLAAISSKFSQCAKDMARAAGETDFFKAYPFFAQHFTPEHVEITPFPSVSFVNSSRRRSKRSLAAVVSPESSDDEDDIDEREQHQRNVRRRTTLKN